MNSKTLEDRVKEIEEETADMRILKRSEKDGFEEKEKAVNHGQSTVSLKHYDQVSGDGDEFSAVDLVCDFS